MRRLNADDNDACKQVSSAEARGLVLKNAVDDRFDRYDVSSLVAHSLWQRSAQGLWLGGMRLVEMDSRKFALMTVGPASEEHPVISRKEVANHNITHQ